MGPWKGFISKLGGEHAGRSGLCSTSCMRVSCYYAATSGPTPPSDHKPSRSNAIGSLPNLQLPKQKSMGKPVVSWDLRRTLVKMMLGVLVISLSFGEER